MSERIFFETTIALERFRPGIAYLVTAEDPGSGRAPMISIRLIVRGEPNGPKFSIDSRVLGQSLRALRSALDAVRIREGRGAAERAASIPEVDTEIMGTRLRMRTLQSGAHQVVQLLPSDARERTGYVQCPVGGARALAAALEAVAKQLDEAPL